MLPGGGNFDLKNLSEHGRKAYVKKLLAKL